MTAAVVFDLYGTLLRIPYDSRPFHELARRSANENTRHALELALTTDNTTLADFASRIGLPLQEDLPELDAALQRDIAGIHTFPDAVPALCELKSRGVRTALISNLSSPYKQPFFDLQLNKMFDVVVFSCDCGLRKPNLEIYEMTLKRLGTPATETVMVGDSFRSDVDGPSQVGIIGFHLVRSGNSSMSANMVSSLKALLEKAT